MGRHQNREKNRKGMGRQVAAATQIKSTPPPANQLKVNDVERILRIPLDRIKPFERQPRRHFRNIPELAASIKAMGQLDPGIVTPISGNPKYDYQLIDGERRYRACKLAEIGFFRATLKRTGNEEEQFAMAVAANHNREPHTPLEISEAIQRLHESGKSGKEIAAIFGRSEPWVYQYLGLRRLVPEVQAMMDPDLPDDRRLSFSLALMISGIVTEKQREAAEHIISKGLGFKKAQFYIRRLLIIDPESFEGEQHGPARRWGMLQGAIIRIERETELLLGSEEDPTIQEEYIKDLVRKTCTPQDRRALTETINAAIGNLRRLEMVINSPYAHGTGIGTAKPSCLLRPTKATG